MVSKSGGTSAVRRETQDLLRLIPPDSGVILTVDDLRGQVGRFLTSRLADGASESCPS